MHALIFAPDPTAVPADEATVAAMEQEYRDAIQCELRDLQAKFAQLGKQWPQPRELQEVARRLDAIESSFLFLDGAVIAKPTDTLSL